MERKTFIVLWPTGKCNLKCKYCYAYSENWQIDMDFETAKNTLDYFKDTPMKIQFAGGEPLLNFELICKVYEYVKKQNYRAEFQLQTNGMLINEEIAAGIAKMQIKTGVSIDGPIAVNEQLRGGTKQTINGIQNLGRADVMTSLNSTVTAQNVDALPELLELALYLGNIAGIGLDVVRLTGRAGAEKAAIQEPTKTQLIRALRVLHEKSTYYYKNVGIKIGIRPIEEAKKRLASPGGSKDYCYATCGKSYVVLPNGDIYPCPSLMDKEEYCMGNINTGTIKRICLTSTPKTEACSSCAYVDFCPGGCPSRMLINGYESVGNSLDCALRKTAFEIAQQYVR